MSLHRFRLGRFFPIVCLITVAAFAGCASSTVLQSQPPGARVFLNGVPVGTTPYTMTDTNMSGTATQVRFEYPGFEPFNAMIVRSEELDPLALIGGIFLLVPFLWILGYQPTHFFTMQPLGGAQPPTGGGWGAPPPQGCYPPGPPAQGGYPPAPPPQGGYPPGPPPAGYPPPPPAGYPPPPPGYPPAQ
jgi:hypothetical protein